MDIAPASLLDAIEGVSYDAIAVGGETNSVYELVSRILPTGISLSGENLSGTPTATDTNTFLMEISSSDGIYGMRQFTLTVE